MYFARLPYSLLCQACSLLSTKECEIKYQLHYSHHHLSSANKSQYYTHPATYAIKNVYSVKLVINSWCKHCKLNGVCNEALQLDQWEESVVAGPSVLTFWHDNSRYEDTRHEWIPWKQVSAPVSYRNLSILLFLNS